jgi:hypothetical protein
MYTGLPVGVPFPYDCESWREYAEHCLTHDPMPRVTSSVGSEHFLDTEEARGSSPLSPTSTGG